MRYILNILILALIQKDIMVHSGKALNIMSDISDHFMENC